jgi:hypothetical protein
MKNQKQESEILNQFHKLGVKDVDLDGLSIMNQWKVLDAFQQVAKDFPCICGAVSFIKMADSDQIDDDAEATTVLSIIHGKRVIGIYLNATFFTSPFFPLKLWYEKSTHFAAGKGIKGVVIHELGHVLHYLLDMNKYPYDNTLLVQQMNLQTSTAKIVLQVQQKLHIKATEIRYYLSIYGSSDSDEAIAEGISEYYTTKEPRAFSTEIFLNMKNLL